MSVDKALENMKEVETVSFDNDKFVNMTTKIGSVEQFRDSEGNIDVEDKFKPGKKVRKIVVKTEVLGIQEGKNGKVEIKASEVFNLSQDSTTKEWGIPTDDRSNLKKFMASKGAKTFKDLIGKTVVVRKRGNYLGFYKN